MVDIVNTPEEGNASAVTEKDSNIPEQFQGKSAEDLVGMYQNLERKLGQQSEELGSLRKLADQTLLGPQQASSEGYEEVDFYTDPERAVERIIESKLRPFNEIAQRQSLESTQKRLSADFPGWEDTIKSTEFAEWVGKSKVRTKLYLEADSSGDYDTAAELLGTWNELGQSKAQNQSAERKAVDRDRKLRAATTEKGTAGIDPRKVLSRADLRSLKQNNPSRYNDLLPDIRKAYAEGRVKE